MQVDVFDVTHALDAIRRRGNFPNNELRLLTYVVEQALAGQGANLSQKTIAADVFGRDLVTFHPRSDSIVRTTAANVRDRLFAYYSGPGQDDPVSIELARGTYVPSFSLRPKLSANAASRLWSARVAIESRTVTGYDLALKYLETVLGESPSLSLALALKAEALASQAIHGARPRPNLEEARRLAIRAIDQTKPVWQAYLSMGMVQHALEWNWPGAAESYGKAVELSGGEAAVHVLYNAYLVARGRTREGIALLERTVDKFAYSNPTYLGDLSMMQILAREYVAAGSTIDAAIAVAPGYYQHHLNLSILLEAKGDPEAAVRVLDETPLKLMERPVTWGLRAMFAGFSGAPDVARRRLTWLRTIERTGKYIPPSQLAACWLGAGDHDKAVEFLERAAEHRDPLAVWFHAYPFFRHLHGHRRFQRLMDTIGVVWRSAAAAG